MNAKIAALVLAAGHSRRYGSNNKLLAPYCGKPLICHSLETLAGIDFCARLLVTGHDSEAVAALGEQCGFSIIYNPQHEQGVGTSLARGVAALMPDVDGVLICLGDMPAISTSLVQQLLASYQAESIVAPCKDGRRGQPVLFARPYFHALCQLRDDRGGKAIIESHLQNLILVPSASDEIFFDVDEPLAEESL